MRQRYPHLTALLYAFAILLVFGTAGYILAWATL